MKKRSLSILMSIMLIFSLLPLHSSAMRSDDRSSGNMISDDVNKEEDNESSDPSDDDDRSGADRNAETGDPKSDPSENPANVGEDEDLVEKEKWIKYLQENQIDPEDEGDSKELSQRSNEDGKYVISLDGASIFTSSDISLETAQTASSTNKIKKRYNVLVLDISASMRGTPMDAMKKASKKFIQAVLKDKSENHIALVPYGSGVSTITYFTKDKKELDQAVNRLNVSGATNTNLALRYADSLLSEIPDEEGVIKNIILLSDGIPNEGDRSISGKYDYSDHYNYAYANACYDTASGLKNKKYQIYTLGFFHNLEGQHLAFGRRFMSDLQNAGYYDVDDPGKLEFVFGEIANDMTEITGKFKYPGTVGNKDYEETYFYKDAYFKKTSYIYDHQLATMSLCLELSACASSDETEYINKTVNARNLLTEIGFSDFAQNTFYDDKPKRDSIGAIAASKKITVNSRPYTLIALAVRGGGYESEWASNFTMGERGYHKGFREARDNVIDFLQKYIEKNNIQGDIKLWITGYSRGGGTANLVAGKINEGTVSFKKCRLIPEDMYTYTFEAPQGALKGSTENTVHKNIFNRINLDDPVPYVAPEYWNFKRYGTDKFFPHPAIDAEVYNKEFKDMKKRFSSYKSVAGEEYIVDKFSMKKIDTNTYPFPVDVDVKTGIYQGLFLKGFLNLIVEERIGTRTVYVKKYEEGIREILGTIYQLDNEQKEKFKKVFFPELRQILLDVFASKMKGADMTDQEIENRVKVSLDKSLRSAGVTSYNLDLLVSGAKAVSDLLIKTIKDHPNLAITAVKNSEGILQAHYPEVCLAWMQSMDSNYVAGAKAKSSTGKGRKIRINCPVDVEIYDANTDTLVAQIVSEDVVDVGSGMIYGINEDGEKFAFLPSDA
ncbi:MAG: VWA domain-containing protein, partial [Peptostreptococcaceae bacterium]|nr:VWA domain-containing protein [Peptostreptococcaceae bacterium]